MNEAKPFCISKKKVWEAYKEGKQIKGQQGSMNGRSKVLKAQAVQGLFAGGLAQVRKPIYHSDDHGHCDPTAEWRRLSEHYRRMSDDELLVLARQNSELTEAAQQALADEVCQRGLKLQPEMLSAPPNPEPQPDSPYAEDPWPLMEMTLSSTSPLSVLSVRQRENGQPDGEVRRGYLERTAGTAQFGSCHLGYDAELTIRGTSQSRV